ncbi:MAG: hypothetical protein ACFWTY_14830 [Shouchella clausii]|jgi:hypothetical protein
MAKLIWLLPRPLQGSLLAASWNIHSVVPIKGKRFYPHSKGIEEKIIESVFIKTYNFVCSNHKDGLDELFNI